MAAPAIAITAASTPAAAKRKRVKEVLGWARGAVGRRRGFVIRNFLAVSDSPHVFPAWDSGENNRTDRYIAIYRAIIDVRRVASITNTLHLAVGWFQKGLSLG